MSDDPVIVKQTSAYRSWFEGLRDREAKLRIDSRLRRIRRGLFGDAKSIGSGVSELRIDYGPGYRLYFARRGSTVVIILAGGDKRTQRQDIALARRMATDLSDENDSRTS